MELREYLKTLKVGDKLRLRHPDFAPDGEIGVVGHVTQTTLRVDVPKRYTLSGGSVCQMPPEFDYAVTINKTSGKEAGLGKGNSNGWIPDLTTKKRT